MVLKMLWCPVGDGFTSTKVIAANVDEISVGGKRPRVCRAISGVPRLLELGHEIRDDALARRRSRGRFSRAHRSVDRSIRMSSSSSCSSALATGPGLPSPIVCVVPLDDGRHLDRAAEQQHLARRVRLVDRDVANLDAVQQPLVAERSARAPGARSDVQPARM